MSEAKTREVFPGIFLVHLPLPMKPTIVNVYLVRGGEEWALVDTGVNSPESVSAFRAALETAGCTPDRLRKIICTHHHPDHFGASTTFKELSGATLYLHRAEHERARALMAGERHEDVARAFLAHGFPVHRFVNVPHPKDFWGHLYVPASPDVFMGDGDVIRVGEREIRVIWTPGHAPGHCVLYLPDDRVMIAGDHLLPKITPHVGYVPGSAENPLADFLDSLRKIQDLRVDSVLPAHGGLFVDYRRRISQIIHHHDVRLREMLDILRRRPRNGYDVARRAFGFDSESPITYQFPATFETLAHLEYLRHRGQLERDEREGQLLYRSRADNHSG